MSRCLLSLAACETHPPFSCPFHLPPHHLRQSAVLILERLHQSTQSEKSLTWKNLPKSTSKTSPIQKTTSLLCGIVVNYFFTPTTSIHPALQSFIPSFGQQTPGWDLPRNAWVQLNCLRIGFGRIACASQICVSVARCRVHTTSCMTAPNLRLHVTFMKSTILHS